MQTGKKRGKKQRKNNLVDSTGNFCKYDLSGV